MDENRAMIVEISEVPEIQVPNYEDLLSRLTEEMEAYRNYQVTEDNIPEAKKVKANLNKRPACIPLSASCPAVKTF